MLVVGNKSGSGRILLVMVMVASGMMARGNHKTGMVLKVWRSSSWSHDSWIISSDLLLLFGGRYITVDASRCPTLWTGWCQMVRVSTNHVAGFCQPVRISTNHVVGLMSAGHFDGSAGHLYIYCSADHVIKARVMEVLQFKEIPRMARYGMPKSHLVFNFKQVYNKWVIYYL